MWASFVFFDKPRQLYFIEGDNLEEATKILWSTFGKVGIIDKGKSDIQSSEYLTTLLGTFCITDAVFYEHHTDPVYFKKSKEEIPLTQRSVVRVIDGEYCKMCQDFYNMAVGNQSDGSLVCWACRDSNKWMFL